MPEKFFVTLVLGDPGGFAVFGDDTVPFTIEALPSYKGSKLFASNGPLTQLMHLFESVDSLGKIIVSLPKARAGYGSLEMRSRSGVGYLIHLLRWFKLPLIVTDQRWLEDVKGHYGEESAIDILKKHFPRDLASAYCSEACAQAALLSFIAIRNPGWQGISLAKTHLPEISEKNDLGEVIRGDATIN